MHLPLWVIILTVVYGLSILVIVVSMVFAENIEEPNEHDPRIREDMLK